ncbi:unnamed protein product [Gongylonema pulchrum]|uniref:Thiamine transporter 2 n=1 Tax=Gongylonema pulchrum TaxID=637853 RepID=A0A183CVW3_9BILA|nr:unnamed protein product [Gongylonema pulchrum]
MHWKATIVLICAFGIIKEFRPATPFLTPFLMSPPKNFTNVQVYSEIYPYWTYSYMVFLVPSFFLTDLLRYKPIVLVEAVSLCVTWILLIWGKTIWQMQIMQIAFGIASSCEIAYESYMFLIVDQKYYALVASYTRAATLAGRFFAYALAQFLISFKYGSYLLLNQISFVATCIIIPIGLAFPPITKEMIANRARKEEAQDQKQTTNTTNVDQEGGEASKERGQQISKESTNPDAKPPVEEQTVGDYFRSMFGHFKVFKRNSLILKWSIWWALTSCGVYQVMNYAQSLWATMQIISDTFNGIAECANTLIGALISFGVQYMRVNWVARGEYILFGTSLAIAVFVAIMSQSKSIAVSYVLYVGNLCLWAEMCTCYSANIASQLDSASYGFVFGLDTFIALLLETILTFAVADKHGLALYIREQVPQFLFLLAPQSGMVTCSFFTKACQIGAVG